jgi:electron transfer flavoprotein beta subunit
LSNSAEAEKMLRRALAVNAAEAVLVMSQEYGETFNSFQSAYVLCKALAALSFQPDLILAGRQAADTDAGHVGPLVAELLGWPCVTLVGRLEMRDGRLVAQGVEGDYEYVWEVELPAVVTVTSAPGNQLRYPKVKDLIAAQKRPVTRVDDLISIGVSREELMRWGDRMQVSRLELAGGTRKCEVIRGADPDAMANAAVDWLRKKGIV